MPEENGLQRLQAYVASLDGDAVAKLLAMVNYDTIAGATSSMSTRPLRRGCRVQLCRAGTASIPRCAIACWPVFQAGALRHPPADGCPEGETGSWSITRLCPSGVPVAYVEATNFTINGEDGYDGYSQSTNPALWDC